MERSKRKLRIDHLSLDELKDLQAHAPYNEDVESKIKELEGKNETTKRTKFTQKEPRR